MRLPALIALVGLSCALAGAQDAQHTPQPADAPGREVVAPEKAPHNPATAPPAASTPAAAPTAPPAPPASTMTRDERLQSLQTVQQLLQARIALFAEKLHGSTEFQQYLQAADQMEQINAQVAELAKQPPTVAKPAAAAPPAPAAEPEKKKAKKRK